jgi:hypothetical protein
VVAERAHATNDVHEALFAGETLVGVDGVDVGMEDYPRLVNPETVDKQRALSDF